MNFEDIPEFDRTIYKKNCECCDMPIIIATQRDSYPEYYTGVYIQCNCGEWLEFELPVN